MKQEEKKNQVLLLKRFRTPARSTEKLKRDLGKICKDFSIPIEKIKTEWCYYIELKSKIDKEKKATLSWLLSETFEPKSFSSRSFLQSNHTIIEIGPRLNFETAFSTTAVNICNDCGLLEVTRLERSIRYGFPVKFSDERQEIILSKLCDRMTEQRYEKSLRNFKHGLTPAPVKTIPIIEKGKKVLEKINSELGLAMDEQDLNWCYDLFTKILKKNPTDVEIFQLGQANSEHCRHGFFSGKIIIDGKEQPESLMEIVKSPWKKNPNNSVIAFHDDSSAICGIGPIKAMIQDVSGALSPLVKKTGLFHPALTAETHNFPSGVAPRPGAQTGTGGRIRDNISVGRGGQMMAGGAGYCTGNLHIPGYPLPCEKGNLPHPVELASPLDIMIGASNGASEYGNCIGEPVIYGFTRTLGTQTSEGYRSWFKPIMYSDGIGQLNSLHIKKGHPEKGMLIIKIGGPAYRIGMGGGAASSMMQGDNKAELDFNAVQRGAPEMEQRVWRVIRACIELGKDNPIVTVHDLGAGGDCNALPELLLPSGGRIELRSLPIGDSSLSVLEIWGNESQEREAFLIRPESLKIIQKICERESVSLTIAGEVVGDSMIVLHDSLNKSNPVELPLGDILEKLPKKTFNLTSKKPELLPLLLPKKFKVKDALDMVLRLPSVCSKGYLTRKVDRSVTGLVIQQQCVGPNHLPLSDHAILAQGYWDELGIVSSLGEQPLAGLISPKAMARLAVAESLLNMSGASITKIKDIRCSANWMWAAKLPNEGARLYEAALALKEILLKLGMAIDGGKDSLSMAAKTLGQGKKPEIVKAPGELVIAAYAPMADVSRRVSIIPEIDDNLLLIDLSPNKKRLGGSALAQALGQVGDQCPDVDNISQLKKAFSAIQELVKGKHIHAVHDISDGGMIVTLLEMAFAGNVGALADIKGKDDVFSTFFSQEPGVLIAFPKNATSQVKKILTKYKLKSKLIGKITKEIKVFIKFNNKTVLQEEMPKLRAVWEQTSSEIDKFQANPECVKQEKKMASVVTPPPYKFSFNLSDTSTRKKIRPKLAILRSQGSNGDREMAVAFMDAGFEVWDITMKDLLSKKINLDDFRGLVFVGGFSYGDILDSAKGWAGVIRFNKILKDQFDRFYNRKDTFSFGVCNGCQLMALLGWIPSYGLKNMKQPRFIANESERFESRFPTVIINESPAIMLKDMAGSVLGVWVAHGEGRFHLDSNQFKKLVDRGQTPIRYVDRKGKPTEVYPYNPNGSPGGITALCSEDGRHLAMMPHPERTFQMRQWPWLPPEWKNLSLSPWFKMFQNAFEFCQDS